MAPLSDLGESRDAHHPDALVGAPERPKVHGAVRVTGLFSSFFRLLWLPALIGLLLVPARVHAAEPQSEPPRDTDDDGIPDAEEDTNRNGHVDRHETDPRSADTDEDLVPDAVELRLGTDPTNRSDTPPIPEPLVFDLVRNLGAHGGELEVNTLATASLRRPRALLWAPEIEYAIVEGFAGELELPFHEGTLEAVKVGLQKTIGRFGGSRGIHGVQLLAQRAIEGGVVEGTALYVLGLRFDSTFSTLVIAGARIETSREDPRVRGSAILNPSFFAQLSRSFTVGLEVNASIATDGRVEGLVMPQLHVSPLPFLKLQGGLGVQRELGATGGLLALRVSVER